MTPPPPIVGRRDELQAIEPLLLQPPAAARLVVVEGRAGIGKTTVWRAAADAASQAGWEVRRTGCSAHEARLPYAALADLFGDLPDSAVGSLPEPQRRALAVALLREEPDAAGEHPRALGAAVHGVLARLAAAAPVMVAIDDVQWIDAASARALTYAIRRLDPARVIVLASLRSGERIRPAVTALLDSVAHDRVTTFRLGPLDRGELALIVRSRVDRKLGAAAMARICAASAGNPLYAIEIARLGDGTDGTDGVGRARGPAVPTAITQLVTRRLRLLPPATRDALLRAAAQQRPSARTVDVGALGPAEAAGLVTVDPEGRIAFAHPLFAAAVYRSAAAPRRRRVHAALADLAAVPEERIRHLALATTRPDRSVAADLDAAVVDATRRGAVDEAVELAHHALRLTPLDAEPDLWARRVVLARSSLRLGDVEAAATQATAVVSAAPPSAARASALQVLGELRMMEGCEDGVALLHQALETPGVDRITAIRLELTLATVDSARGDLADALVHAQRAHDLLRTGDHADLVAEVYARLAMARFHMRGDFDEEEVARAIADARPQPDASIWTWALMSLVYLHFGIARLDVAAMILERMRRALLDLDDVIELPWVESYLALARASLGDLGAAERHAAAALALTEHESSMVRSAALKSDAVVALAQGRSARAAVAADEALELARRTPGWRTGIAEATWIAAAVRLEAGDPSGALELLEREITAMQHAAVPDFPHTVAAPEAFEVLVQAGRWEEAAALADAMVTRGQELGMPWPHAIGLRGRALVLAARGDLAGAAAAVDAACKVHDVLGMPLETARTLVVGGQIARRDGRRRVARSMLTEARQLAAACGAVTWVRHADAELARLGTRRARRG